MGVQIPPSPPSLMGWAADDTPRKRDPWVHEFESHPVHQFLHPWRNGNAVVCKTTTESARHRPGAPKSSPSILGVRGRKKTFAPYIRSLKICVELDDCVGEVRMLHRGSSGLHRTACGATPQRQ